MSELVLSNKFQKKELKDLYLKNMMLMSLVTGFAVIPFVINYFIYGQYITFLFDLLVVVIAFANFYQIKKNESLLIPNSIWFLFLLGILITHMHQGIHILFWSYPLYLCIYFAQTRIYARVMACIAFISLSVTCLFFFEPPQIGRFLMTSLLLIVFSDLLIGVVIDFEKRLNELVIRDPLTNAFNRRFLEMTLDNLLEEINRHQSPNSLILFDIDNFKNINDEYGHQVGDQALTEIVSLINKRKRKIDYLFRVGGEEFAILLKKTDQKTAYILADKLRLQVADAELINECQITISIGVAELDKDEKAHSWMQRTDKALYEAKNQGRNRVCIALS